MSLYGTRDAAMNWQKLVSTEMEKIGFKRGTYNPCTYHHPERKIDAVVHGYDYCSVGNREDVEWFRMKLDHRFSIKTTVVGPGADDQKEVRLLNRVIRMTEHGWEY